MVKNNRSIKISDEFYYFVENVRATRMSKITGTDKVMLDRQDIPSLIVKYFKLNNDRFVELIKMEFQKNV